MAGVLTAAASAALPKRLLAATSAFDPESWASIRAQFELDPHAVNLSAFLLASHPAPVRHAIERHARALDQDAKRYLDHQRDGALAEAAIRSAAGRYLHVRADELALTESTTMGLALLYSGLQLSAGDEILTTTHDFYSTHVSLSLRALRTGARIRKISLYRDARHASVDEILAAVKTGIRTSTRVLAITWVHSSTGVKLPIPEIAAAVRAVNRERAPADRVLICVDGVHGFGIEAATPHELGCDFLVSGCHKWLFGPRGTGIIWGRGEAWRHVLPTIPTFDLRAFPAWFAGASVGASLDALPRAAAMTPGGFHSFEHRWALREAFDFRQAIGAQRAAVRTHALATQLKEGLQAIKGVHLVTPTGSALSAGLVCFSVDGRDPSEIVARLYQRGRIVASVTPYATPYVRLGPSIVNTPRHIERTIRAVHAVSA